MTRERRRSIKEAAAALAIAAAVIAAGIFLARVPGDRPTVRSHGQEIMGLRTVLVSTNDVEASQPGRPLHARLVAGAVPTAETMATVMSDEDCAPDAMGVSHCLNRMKLEDGTEMTVQHPHRMSEVPCLAPGERVRVMAAT